MKQKLCFCLHLWEEELFSLFPFGIIFSFWMFLFKTFWLFVTPGLFRRLLIYISYYKFRAKRFICLQVAGMLHCTVYDYFVWSFYETLLFLGLFKLIFYDHNQGLNSWVLCHQNPKTNSHQSNLKPYNTIDCLRQLILLLPCHHAPPIYLLLFLLLWYY